MSDFEPRPRSWLENLRYDIELIHAEYGYTAGWFVEAESDGRRIAILSNPEWAEMFWTSYEVEELEQGAINKICKSDGGNLIYRNRRFSEEIVYAIPSIVHDEQGLINGRVHMRALYLKHRPSWLARICAMFVRRREGRRP